MIKEVTLSVKISRVIIVVILTILALSCIVPILYTLAISLSSKTAVAAGKVGLWPVDFTLFSYKEIIKDSGFFTSIFVSFKRVILGTFLSIGSIVLAAYPLSKSKQQFKAQSVIMWCMVFCMMFTGGLVPWYQNIKSLGLIDTIWGLVLAGGFPVFNLILVVNFFRNIPREMDEAAMVDGAGPWRTLFQIYLPLALPVLATVVLFTVVDQWNEFFNGLVLTTRTANYPLQTYIQQLVVVLDTKNMTAADYARLDQMSNQTLNAAKIFVAMVPVLLIYPLLQRYFITGITLGSVKE